MKKIFVLIILNMMLFILNCNDAHCQYFNKYYMWASEKHMDPGENNDRLPFYYNNILFTLTGNFYGAKTINNIDIPGIAYLLQDRNGDFAIYTVESRGYRVLDPVIEYHKAQIVNAQENLTLDFDGNVINNIPAQGDAYTEHPTVEQTT